MYIGEDWKIHGMVLRMSGEGGDGANGEGPEQMARMVKQNKMVHSRLSVCL